MNTIIKNFRLAIMMVILFSTAKIASAQWTRNAATSQTYLTNTADNLGVGTTSPSFKLDVQSTTNATMSFKSTNGNSAILLDRSDSTKTASLTYRTNGSNNWQTGCVSGNNYTIRNNGLSSNALYISYAGNNVGIGTNSPVNRLSVSGSADFSGNVGLGTTTPSYKLHVKGAGEGVCIQGLSATGSNVGFMTFRNSAATRIGYIGDGSSANDDISIGSDIGNLSLWTPAGQVLTATSTGNVGIGTISPGYKLDTREANSVTTGIHDVAIFRNAAATAGIVSGWYANGSNVTGGSLRSIGTLPLFLGTTNSYQALTILDNGNVGIGTATPSSKLEVRDGTLTIRNTIGSAHLILDKANTSSGFSNQISFMESGSPKWSIGGSNIGSAGLHDFSLYNYNTANNALTVLSSNGNVGIGTTNPISKFVVSNGGIEGFEVSNNPGYTSLASYNRATSSYLPLVLNEGGGNVGIGTGTSSPGHRLDVAGRMRVRSGNGTAGIWLMNAANTVDAGFVGMMTDDQIGFYGSNMGYWGLSMSTVNGNVGIGTGNPGATYKLDVCGTIRAKEIRVETNWCDYVFANDYKLAPLSEVETFIKENKHLPDVTAGNIIETEGLEVGKVSSMMIRKIEELTLYVIDLQKQVDELKKSNK